MGAPIKGYNAYVEVQALDGSWLEVAKTQKVPGFKGTNEMSDVTTTRSQNRHRERAVTLRDTGAMSFSGIYDPTSPTHQVGAANSMSKLLATGETRNFRTNIGGVLSIVIPCVVTQWEIGEAQASNIVEVMCELTPVSGPTSGMD